MAVSLPVKLSEIKESLMSGGQPVVLIDLYVIHLRTGNVFFSACDEDIDWFIPGTNTEMKYIAQPVERGAVKSTVDNKIDNVELKISNVGDIFTAALFNGYDFRGCTCDIIQIAYPDSLHYPEEFRYIFSGQLDAPSLNERDKIFTVQVISKLPNYESGRIVMLSCTAEFGDPEQCGARKSIQYGVAEEGSTYNTILDSRRIEPEGSWDNGVVLMNGQAKKILKSAPGAIEVEYPFWGIPSGQYEIQQGCDKTQSTCINKFSNGINFNGFPAIPFEVSIVG